jgi:hypothetical protein
VPGVDEQESFKGGETNSGMTEKEKATLSAIADLFLIKKGIFLPDVQERVVEIFAEKDELISSLEAKLEIMQDLFNAAVAKNKVLGDEITSLRDQVAELTYKNGYLQEQVETLKLTIQQLNKGKAGF